MSTLSIKIGAVLDGSFNAAIKGSSGQLSSLGENIRRLDSSLKSVSKFKQLGSDILASKKSWKGFEDQVKSLAKQIKAVEKPSKTLKAEFDKAKASATKAKVSYLKKRDSLHSLNEEVRKSGTNIKSLVRDQYKLGSSVETLKSKYSKLGSVIQKQQNALAKKAYYKSQVIETVGLGLALASPIKVAIDFESAMADVKKVVDFTPNTDQADKFAQKLKEMSRTIPLSAAELAQIAASGGQLGIPKDDLFKFTETVAKMSTAFDMSAEQAGDSIAKLANVYDIKVSEMEHVGNVINHLSDNTAAKARDMVQALGIVGGTAKQFGLKFEETSSLVNAFISLGKQPAKAATAINALLSKLQTAEGQGQEFKAALEDIGITAEEMAQRIGQNGQEALLYFFETLEKVDNQERSKILMKLFGQEYQDDIALLVGSLKKYKEAIAHLDDKEKYKKSMGKEFENRAKTTANNLRLLRNTIAELGMNLGSVMLPPLNWISEVLRSVSTGIAWFAEKCPIITTGIMSIISLLILGKIAMVSFGYAIALVKGGAATLSVILHGPLGSALVALSSYVIPAVVTGFRVLTAAMISNPIGAIIALLSVGALLVITNWQKVKDFFSSVWEYIKSIIKPIGEFFAWIGGGIYGKIFDDSPLKEFEKRESIVSLVDGKVDNALTKNSIFSDGNPLLNNSVLKEISENSKNNIENSKIKSVIEEKKSVESNNNKEFKDFAKNKCENKTFNQTQHINISIQAAPNQDVHSLADEVIKRIREKSRDVLFDTMDSIY
ncbi:phage tail tape measure protein [Wolbachia endosymbiont of Folsomia candida]|uniref:phage tail tape measure protein n=1 Tax=Wolbachia endosymbiont of Folsomia candida TaxID=169402 RepID=UPI000B25AD0C|nr:phage tail tape measure protein [Wolbachia endosymbiont of Folsomia candida]APR99025.1 phage tail tape measure protein [Wolbachia endosymbiont of Folsomia candida]